MRAELATNRMTLKSLTFYGLDTRYSDIYT